jgi:hypothetical protein
MGSRSLPSWGGPWHGECTRRARRMAARARRAVTTCGHGQRAWCGVELDGKPSAQNLHRWQENNLWHPANLSLYQNLKGDSGSGILTGAKLDSVVVLDVEEGNNGKRGRGRCPATTQAKGRHKELMRTLGRWWAAWRGGAHRWWWVAPAWSDGDGKGDDIWWHSLGQKKCQNMRISYAWGIIKWWCGMMASQWWRNGGSSPQHWGKSTTKGEASATECFYSWRSERGGDYGPARRRQGTGGLPVARRFPLSWVFDGWASIGFWTRGVS